MWSSRKGRYSSSSGWHSRCCGVRSLVVLLILNSKTSQLESYTNRYSDLDPKVAELRNPDGSLVFSAGNVCMHYYSFDFLATTCHPSKLPSEYHVARKKIPYVVFEREARECLFSYSPTQRTHSCISILIHLLRGLTRVTYTTNKYHPCHSIVSLTRNNTTRMLRKYLTRASRSNTGT